MLGQLLLQSHEKALVRGPAPRGANPVRWTFRPAGGWVACKHRFNSTPDSHTVIVLCGLAWVRDSAYDASDEEVARAIDQVLRTRHLQVQNRDQVRAAPPRYKGSGADFPDCLVGQLCLRAGSDETVTFDHAAARLSHWRELEWWP
ncbi:Conserved hypothetical protein containing PIN domain [Salinibacter ruber M8]|jgi:predicted nucleic-acid-binding protein|uniref:Uncharacterized protein n=1 Tax=Salinibacter ruber (strain M8) TaxID=761659 RepID=D5H544_SALRM|nr:Conserved hypothetical protein containing PIN domain [Salinibacter ruber M8]